MAIAHRLLVPCPSAQKDTLARVLSHLTEAVSLGQRRQEQLHFSHNATAFQLIIAESQLEISPLPYRLSENIKPNRGIALMKRRQKKTDFALGSGKGAPFPTEEVADGQWGEVKTAGFGAALFSAQ